MPFPDRLFSHSEADSFGQGFAQGFNVSGQRQRHSEVMPWDNTEILVRRKAKSWQPQCVRLRFYDLGRLKG